MKNALKFYWQLERKNKKNYLICLVLILLPIIIFQANDGADQSIRDISQQRLNSINFLANTYQSLIGGTNGPELENLNRQNGNLARMIVNTRMPNEHHFLIAAILYGEALEEFYQDFENENDFRFLPNRNLVALETAEYMEIQANNLPVAYTGESAIRFWQRIFGNIGTIVFFLTVLWCSDTLINEVKRKQFSNSLPFGKTERILAPIIIRTAICFLSYLLFFISAFVLHFFSKDPSMSYPIGLMIGQRVWVVPLVSFLLFYLLALFFVVLLAVSFTLFCYSFVREIFQTVLIVMVVGVLPIILPSVWWRLGPFSLLNPYHLLRGDFLLTTSLLPQSIWSNFAQYVIWTGVFYYFAARKMMKGVN